MEYPLVKKVTYYSTFQTDVLKKTYGFFLFYFSYIINSKTRVGFREIFQFGKVFHRPRSLKISDLLIQNNLINMHKLMWGAKEVAIYCSSRPTIVQGHVRTVLQAPVRPTCLVLTTCLRVLKWAAISGPKYIVLLRSANLHAAPLGCC